MDRPSGDDDHPSAAPAAVLPRVLVWYEGNSDTFFRISERIADWLAEGLPPEHIGLALTARAECLTRVRSKGYAVFPYSGPAGRNRLLQLALSIPASIRRFAEIMNQFRPDAVIVTSNFGLAWPMVRVARQRGIRIIYLPHDPQPHSGDFAPLWQRFTQRQIVRRSQALVFLSEAMREAGRDLGGEMASLPSFVAPLHSLGTPIVAHPRAAVVSRPLRFLFLGRMIRYKGLDLLAEACRLLADRHDWQLTLAGDGPEAARARTDFANMPQVDLSHLRYLDEPEIDHLNLTHDVLVCPYRDATQSGAVAEATLTGLPSIVSPVGALPSQVDHGRAGWVMDTMSAEALAARMVHAIESPEAVAAMSKAALDFWRTSRADNVFLKAVDLVLNPKAPRSTTQEMIHAPRP